MTEPLSELPWDENVVQILWAPDLTGDGTRGSPAECLNLAQLGVHSPDAVTDLAVA